ncbi:hypothetical protein [Maridesulfovibrio sp. FT414]|uniref:hypothetical protein n=1 Tax=Maridesulfovibrio sp. FT414 TaxID=2979469 RepID=UPI003D807F14
MKAAYVIVDDSGKSAGGGSGISSTSKESTGVYMINYETDFSNPPGISATPWGSGTMCSVNIMAENMCEVCVTDLQGNAIDSGFAFLAVGD